MPGYQDMTLDQRQTIGPERLSSWPSRSWRRHAPSTHIVTTSSPFFNVFIWICVTHKADVKMREALKWRLTNGFETAGDIKVAQIELGAFKSRILHKFSPIMKKFELETLAEEWRKILFKREDYEETYKGTPEGQHGQDSLYERILAAVDNAIVREEARMEQESPAGDVVTLDSAGVTSQLEELNLSQPEGEVDHLRDEIEKSRDDSQSEGEDDLRDEMEKPRGDRKLAGRERLGDNAKQAGSEKPRGNRKARLTIMSGSWIKRLRSRKQAEGERSGDDGKQTPGEQDNRKQAPLRCGRSGKTK
ncbi:hypothetical protein RUND412_003279 [Rhizina undulata]